VFQKLEALDIQKVCANFDIDDKILESIQGSI